LRSARSHRELVALFNNMKRILALAALLACGNSPQAWSQLVQWPIAQNGNDHFYEVVPAIGGISWSNASAAATNRGGYLATITSSNENEFVFGLASQNTNIWYAGYGPWLGGVQSAGSAEPNGGWSWVTGEPFIFQNWASGQPNNNAGEDRIHFGGLPAISSAWNDLGQNNTNYSRGYVVEYAQHPNVVTLHINRQSTNLVRLSWDSRTNVQYTIGWTDNLSNTVWRKLTIVIGNGTTNTVDDTSGDPRRFYSVHSP
jgi:hypothetical protein